MTKSSVGMIESLSANVQAMGGPALSDQVMTSSDAITAKSSSIDDARWVKGAMGRLDETVPPERAVVVMEACGANCAKVNHGVIDRAVARRRKHQTEEEFIAAEIRKPMAGTRLERRGSLLQQFYTPSSFRGGMRCFCALVRALPEDETLSRTYCHCSKAFVRTLWEAVLGRPVAVELLTSALSGSSECEFTIAIA